MISPGMIYHMFNCDPNIMLIAVISKPELIECTHFFPLKGQFNRKVQPYLFS